MKKSLRRKYAGFSFSYSVLRLCRSVIIIRDFKNLLRIRADRADLRRFIRKNREAASQAAPLHLFRTLEY